MARTMLAMRRVSSLGAGACRVVGCRAGLEIGAPMAGTSIKLRDHAASPSRRKLAAIAKAERHRHHA